MGTISHEMRAYSLRNQTAQGTESRMKRLLLVGMLAIAGMGQAAGCGSAGTNAAAYVPMIAPVL